MQGFCRGKKHAYSSGLIASGTFTVSNLSTVGQKCEPTTNNSTDPAVLNARFNLVSIEGFLFANAQPGTVPLKLKYSSAEQSYALMTPADENRAEFAGYSNPASGEVILGYAYSNDTQDGNGLDNDTWPSGWELARGMNEQSTDGDCDGIADDAEYSLAGFPVSDPMSPSSICADRRDAIRRETTASSDVIRLEMKNFGKSTANNVVFYVAAGSLLTVGSLAAPVPSACVVVPPKFPVPGPSTNYAYRCTFATMAPGASASIAFNVFGLNYGMPANYNVNIESIGSPTPDVAPLNNTAFSSFVL